METCGGKPQDNGASPFNSSNVGVAGSSPAGVTKSQSAKDGETFEVDALKVKIRFES